MTICGGRKELKKGGKGHYGGRGIRTKYEDIKMLQQNPFLCMLT